MKIFKQSLATLLCSILVVGCSGSDEGSATSPPVPTSLAKIDTTNAPVIIGGVVDAVFASGSFGDVLGGGGTGSLVGQAGGGLSKTGGSQKGGLPGLVSSIPIPEVDILCAIDGMVTVSGNVKDPTTLSADDRITLEFFDCDDGAGLILNGIYQITINSVSGILDAGLFALSATAEFIGFEVKEGTEMASLNGAATIDLDTTMSPLTSVAVFSDSVSFNDNTDAATLFEFRTDLTHNGTVVPEAYTTKALGKLTSTLFEGAVAYSTPVTFEGFAGDYPHAGELLVEGAAGATVKLMVQNNVTVILEIDPGDGSGVVTLETTWAELASNAP